jgi:hypothetical protein
MRKLEDSDKWPTIVLRAEGGKSLREIAEEVGATAGAVNQALKRMGIEKAPAPPGPRARRGASPPPPSTPKAPKVKSEKQPRQKAPKAAKPKTFTEVLAGVFEEFGYPNHDMTTPEKAGDALRSMLVSLGLTRLDNLSDDDSDCDENAESDFTPNTDADTDSSGEDDNGDCDGSEDGPIVMPVESYTDNDGCIDGSDEDGETVRFIGYVAEIPAALVNDESSVQTPDADPNEQTLRGEVIDDWGTPPGFTIPDDETLSTMNRDELRKLAANPACRDWKYLKGYSKMTVDDLRANLAKVRNDS